jgi:hypothetical protein
MWTKQTFAECARIIIRQVGTNKLHYKEVLENFTHYDKQAGELIAAYHRAELALHDYLTSKLERKKNDGICDNNERAV